VDGQLAGLLAVSDPIKQSTPEALLMLKAAGLRIVMATGDGLTTAKAVAKRLGIDEVHGEVKPADKLILVEKMQKEGRVVGMAGDGINDAPALAQAAKRRFQCSVSWRAGSDWLSPLPVRQPLEVWLGGTVPAALERCGRLSDGWLASLCTPEEAAAGRVVIDEAAAKAGRSISREHFGVSIGYAREPIDPATARMMAARRPRALDLTPVGLPALRQLIERFIGVGFSKFIVRAVAPPASWRAELEALSAAVGDLQT